MKESLHLEAYQKHLDNLRNDVKNYFGKSLFSVKDFSDLASEAKISTQTLRRFFGKIDREKNVSTTSLNIICNYIGYTDWDSYCKQKNNEDDFIDNTSILKLIFSFYDNVINSNTSIETKEFYDINFDFSETIITNPNFAKQFLLRYQNQKNILQYVFPFFPYYNKCATDWYVKLMESYLNIDKTPHIQVSMNAFLAFGAFLSKNNKKFHRYLSKCENAIEAMREEYEFFYWPETRYAVAKIFEASLQNDRNKILSIIDEFIQRNNKTKSNGIIHTETELLYFNICNALIWTGDFDIANEVYNAFKSDVIEQNHIFCNISKKYIKNRDLKVNGLALTFLENFHNQNYIEYKGVSQWNYSDYENIFQNFSDLVSANKFDISKRISIKSELNYLTEKTGFKKIQDILPLL